MPPNLTHTTLDQASEDAPENLVSRIAEQDKIPWYRKRNLRRLYFVLFPTCICVEMTSGYDSSIMNGLQAVETWNTFFGRPQSTILGLISAMYPIGAVCALPFVPLVADSYGRRCAIILGSIITVSGAVIQACARNFAMFIVARFLLGFGIPFSIIAASSLIGELSHPKERAINGALFNSCYNIGTITAAGVTLGTFALNSNWAWRIPSIIQAVPSLLQLSFIWFLPESPRWLMAHGQHAEARAVLAKYHAEGNADAPFVQAEYAQIEETIAMEVEAKQAGWKDVFSTAGMRRRMLIVAFLGLATQWSGSGLTSYYLPQILNNIGVTDNRTKNTISLARSAWNLCNTTVFSLTVPRLRRRTIFLTCTISVTCILTAWTVASAKYAETHSRASSFTVLVFVFLYGPAYAIGWNVLLYTYLVEILPFRVRAKGITFFQWFSQGAAVFNTFVNPVGISRAGWEYYISYIVFLVFQICFVWFLFPETSGHTLEELAFLFENKERSEQTNRVIKEVQVEEGAK